ncbi:phosphoglycolate phosphatase [Exophiala aquamarina CBS 119918]|uniref:Phosphoglycolate phosphatase n=1 Tax=Exophiala aquamarina CBS 119918 TaxID=1182545 RepID=A0A072PNM0_9EURO|nr:phosphoglycolate phosphatase [Exophiala aquamarina CBS 119918]KEF61317.1 phosphoglycolate phosphatase [Exophiala aquamarina CBS 119918]
MAIKYILFDCDNTLVQSEDLAFEACADLINEIMGKQCLNQHYTGESLIVNLVGQNFRGMMTTLQKQFDFKLEQEELESYVQTEVARVIAKLQAKAEPCDGSIEVLARLYDDKKYKLAVVSSSALRRVRVSIAKAGQEKYFPTDEIYSAATSLPKPTSKPDPAIYLHVLEKYGAKPEECVAIEDSISGATAAVRAKIPLIGYVGSYHTDAKKQEIAGRLAELGCKNVMSHWDEFEKCLAAIEAGNV